MSLESIPKFILLGLAITAIVILTSLYNINQFQTESLEMDIIFNRILYSPNSISYTDASIGRTYLGVIDPARIDESILNKALAYKREKTYSANITLIGQGFIKNGYLQKDWYIRLYPIAKASTKGVGGADYVKKELPVSYISGEHFKKGTLVIEIVRPRR